MLSIPSLSQQPLPSVLDTEFLQQEARRYLEHWASEHWTDYNTHDPGITILEQLAYAITDLDMRTRLDMPSLLAGANNGDFFTARQVLPNAAYTLEDLRRLLIDQEPIRNAWVNSVEQNTVVEGKNIQIEGLYELLLDLEAVQTEEWGTIDLNEYWLKDKFISDPEGKRISYDYFVMFPDWDNLEEFELWSGDKDVKLKHPGESSIVLPVYEGDKIFFFFEVSFTFGSGEQAEDHDNKAFWIHLPEGIPFKESNIQEEFQAWAAAKVGALAFYQPYQEKARLRLQRLNQVRSFITVHRTLTEDFEKISTIKYQYVALKIQELELQPKADPAQVVAQIYFNIEQFLDPQIRPYSFDELLARGKPASEIFEGPLLNNGFIPEESLHPVQRADKIYTSDLVNLIMKIPNIIGLKGLTINLYYDGINRARGVSNCLTLFNQEEYKVKFSFDYSEVKVTKRGVRLLIDRGKIKTLWKKLTNDHLNVFPIHGEGDLAVPAGEDVNLGEYYSIQNEFPRVYGLREGEITSNVTPLRKAQAKQLKAYLLFFEQLLANYCSQLANLQHLFSVGSMVERTDFYQPLYSVPAVQELCVDFVQENIGDASLPWEEFSISCNQYIKRLDDATEGRNTFLERRSGFIDHLLARFAENFTEYAGWAFAKNGSALGPDTVFDKLDFLKNFPALSSQRALAFNYSSTPVWNTENVSGFEKRVAAKLGMPDFRRRSLAQIFDILDYIERYDERDAVPEDPPRTEARFRIWNDRTERVYWRVPVEERNVDRVDSSRFHILLSSTKYYLVVDGSRDLNPEELRAELAHVLIYGKQAAHYAVHQVEPTSSVCRYYFNLLGEDLNEEDPIARRIEYFANRAETENEIRKAIHLMEGRLTEGMHLVEHILLRPIEGSTEHLNPVSFEVEDHEVTFIKDPYSFQISIFLPGWTPRFQDPEFRVVVERTLREEMPAHILPWIYWVELQVRGQNRIVPTVFVQFEKVFRKWLRNQPNVEKRIQSRNEMVEAYNKLVGSRHVTLTNTYKAFDLNP